MKTSIFSAIFFATLMNSCVIGKAQDAVHSISVPAFTAYSMPVSGSWSNNEGMRFSKDGITRWTNTQSTVNFFGKIKTTGDLNISLKLKAPVKDNEVRLVVLGQSFLVSVPEAESFTEVKVGSIKIRDTGFIHFAIIPVKQNGNIITDIASLELSGTAAKDIHFNLKERRNSASVHLRYPFDAGDKVLAFYNEVTVPVGADPITSYYMACGFSRGYFGIQINSPTQRRVIFSIWDSGNEAVDRSKVSADDRVRLLGKGDGVNAGDFGNEGTGGHSHWVYNWKTGSTYRFLVTVSPDTVNKITIYTGYFFVPEQNEWKLIASFSAPKDGKYLSSLYSFVENFSGNSGHLTRKALYSNPYIKLVDGSWKELKKAVFSYDATGRAGDRLDYGAGVENGSFYLSNGGFKTTGAKAGDSFTRPSSKKSPEVSALPGVQK